MAVASTRVINKVEEYVDTRIYEIFGSASYTVRFIQNNHVRRSVLTGQEVSKLGPAGSTTWFFLMDIVVLRCGQVAT
jgi:hypothetical protein